MALYLQHREDGIQWAVWKMEEPLDVLLSLLPNTRKISSEKELPRFTSERRKMEWLSVRVLLYSMLQEDKEIVYSSEGKPFLSDHSFYISISHTKGYVAVALSSLNSVGIDIEQYGQRVHRVSDRYIRPDEQVESYQEDLTWGLLLYWSAKETISSAWRTPMQISVNFVWRILFLKWREHFRFRNSQRSNRNSIRLVIVLSRILC